MPNSISLDIGKATRVVKHLWAIGIGIDNEVLEGIEEGSIEILELNSIGSQVGTRIAIVVVQWQILM